MGGESVRHPPTVGVEGGAPSRTIGRYPSFTRRCAAAKPVGPEPITTVTGVASLNLGRHERTLADGAKHPIPEDGREPEVGAGIEVVVTKVGVPGERDRASGVNVSLWA